MAQRKPYFFRKTNVCAFFCGRIGSAEKAKFSSLRGLGTLGDLRELKARELGELGDLGALMAHRSRLIAHCSWLMAKRPQSTQNLQLVKMS